MDQEERQPRKGTSMEEAQQRNKQPVTTTNDIQDDQANLDNHHVISPEVVEYLNSFPPGYRFLPTDEELVAHYLWKKVKNELLPPNMIHEVHLYKHEPYTLAEEYTPAERYPPAENVWYFFTPRNRKYMNGERPDRGTPKGFWKATGADKPIKSNGIEVGSKKALVHYLGKPSHGVKTPWIMHEFKANNAPPPSRRGTGEVRMRLDDWVLCRIHQKGGKVNKTDRDRNHGNVSDSVSDTSDPTPVQSPRTNGFPPTNAAVSEQSPLVENPPVNEVYSLALQESQPYVRPSQVARNPPAHKMRRSQPYVHSMPLAHDHPSANKVSAKQPKRSQPYVLHSPLARDHLPHVQSSPLAQNPPADELPPEKSQSYCLPETPDQNRFPTTMPRSAQFHGPSAPIEVPIKQEILSMTPHNSSSSSSVSSTHFQSSPAAFPSLQMPENNQSSDYLDYSCNNFDQDFFGYQYNNYDSYFGNNSLNYEEPTYSHNLSSFVEGFDFEPVITGAPISSMASVSSHENTYLDQVNYADLSTTAFTGDDE